MKRFILISIFGISTMVNANDISVDINPKSSKPLTKEVLGVNSLMGGALDYSLPDMKKRYVELGSRVIRFPGGTPANFYNFKTGYYDVPTEKQSKKHHQQMAGLNKWIKKFKEDMGGYRTENFIKFLEGQDTKINLVLNICTQNPSNTKEWLEMFKKSGKDVEYVEIGNEVYFGIYEGLIPSVNDYIRKAKEHAKVVKSVFPKAKIGMVISSHSYTKDKFIDAVETEEKKDRTHTWDQMIAKEDFYDAVIIHLYASPGVNAKVPESKIPDYETVYKHCQSHDDFQYKKTMAYLKKSFPKKEIWVTEYHVGGFGGAIRKYRLRYSHLGVIYAVNFMMKMFQTPEIKLGSHHSFAKMVRRNREGLSTLANYYGFLLFKEPVLNSDRVAGLKIQGQKFYNAKGKYKGKYPEIAGVSFLGDNTAYIFLTNKMGNPHTLKSLKIDGKEITKISSIRQIAPDGDPKKEKVEIKEIIASFPVRLPEYSVTVIKVRFE